MPNFRAFASVAMATLVAFSFGLVSAQAADNAESFDAIMADTEPKIANLLKDQKEHAHTARDVEITFGGKFIQLVEAASERITALGPSVSPRAFKYILEKASDDKPQTPSYWCAIACTNALAKFGDINFEPTVKALEEHAAQEQLLLNELLIDFPASFNFVAKKAATADAKHRKFYVGVLEKIMRHAYSQYWQAGVSQIAKEVGDAKAAHEPMVFLPQPVFKAFSPQAMVVGADLLKVPASSKSEFLASLANEKDENMRTAIIRCLGFLDPPDLSLLKPLEAILQDSKAVKDHPATAESIGRIVFRFAAKSPGKGIASGELASAVAALKVVINEHFARHPVCYSLCEIAASAKPQDSKVIGDSLDAAFDDLSGLQYSVALMRLNGSPSPDAVLTRLLKIAQAPPPKELDRGGFQAAQLTSNAVNILNQLKSNDRDYLKGIASGTGAASATAKTILDTDWSKARGMYRPDLLVRLAPDAVLSAEKIAKLKNDLKSRDAIAFNQTLSEIGRYKPTEVAKLVPDVMREFNARKLGDTSDARQIEILLEKAGPGAAQTVPWLIEKLQSKYSGVSLGAIKTLGAIGPAASSSEPTLRAFAAKNPRSLITVNEALVKMKLQPVAIKGL